MLRTSRGRALALSALLGAAGCQDYNFNPVGECVIQPGTRRVQLSAVTTADVLFVVDDSGSMGGEQEALATNFDRFIKSLNDANLKRVAAVPPLEPIDFHLAVTTTSVFDNLPDRYNPVCRNDCPNTAGSVCCEMSGLTPVAPLLTPKACTGPGDASCPSGSTCQNDCVAHLGDYVCCDGSKSPRASEVIPCATLDAACGDLSTHYRISSDPACAAVTERKYPQGSFVASGTNPAVLHFDKQVYAPAAGVSCVPGDTCTNKDGLPASTLIKAFEENVLVGTCGSNEEQGLEAARRAVEYWMTQPESTREWLHPNSKLVLVFVGDEDDCSSPQDPSKAVVLTGDPGADSCVGDASLPADQQREIKVDDFTSYFSGVRPDQPLGAAFIVSAKSGSSNTCVDDACTAAICCGDGCVSEGVPVCTTNVCGGQAPGTRLLEAAGELRANGADVVAGSICDTRTDPDHPELGFGAILARIAEIVKPPTGLLLPTEPASEDVTLLRIAGKSGKTRKTCNGPAPATITAAEAAAASYDWWFTKTREQVTDDQKHPTTVSKYVFINHATANCEANPGETYAADYIGRLPSNGCSGATAQEADDNCVAMLGGKAGDWTCFAGTDSADRCIIPTNDPSNPIVGTCLCGQRYQAPSAAGRAAAGLCPKGCAPGDAYCPQ
jgi:hypothetical protein